MLFRLYIIGGIQIINSRRKIMNKLFRIVISTICVLYIIVASPLVFLFWPKRSWNQIVDQVEMTKKMRQGFTTNIAIGWCDPKEVTSKEYLGVVNDHHVFSVRTNERLSHVGGACVMPLKSSNGEKFWIVAVSNTLTPEKAEAFFSHELGHIYAGVTHKRTWWCLDEYVSKNIRLIDELTADEWAIRNKHVKASCVFDVFNFIGSPVVGLVRYIRARKIERELGIK
jgi:hypothetical protein